MFCVLTYIYFRYTKNAKVASDVFNDRPLSPEKSVVYWTEYVIRHKGAPHLKSQGLNLTWYQYFMLDVLLVIIILFCTFSLTMYAVFKMLSSYICSYFYAIKTKYE